MEIAVGGRSLKSVRVCPLRNRKPEPTKTRFREAIFEGPTVRYPESLLHRELYYSSDKVGTLPQTLPLSASSSRCQTVYLSHDVRRSLSLSLSFSRRCRVSFSKSPRANGRVANVLAPAPAPSTPVTSLSSVSIRSVPLPADRRASNYPPDSIDAYVQYTRLSKSSPRSSSLSTRIRIFN